MRGYSTPVQPKHAGRPELLPFTENKFCPERDSTKKRTKLHPPGEWRHLNREKYQRGARRRRHTKWCTFRCIQFFVLLHFHVFGSSSCLSSLTHHVLLCSMVADVSHPCIVLMCHRLLMPWPAHVHPVPSAPSFLCRTRGLCSSLSPLTNRSFFPHPAEYGLFL